MSARTSTRAPEVGIVYLVGDKLWVNATPVARAMHLGGYAIHEQDHQGYWKRLVQQRAVPDTDYDRYSRGRVSFNSNSGKFTLLADLCILRKKSVVNAILSRMHLPARGTETGTDNLYRCFRCLGQSR